MKLTNQDVKSKVKNLRGWACKEGQIKKTFEFENFLESINFVNRVSRIAEKLNHHPDILIKYNKITLTLSTHDEGGLTAKDFFLAEKLDTLSI